MLSRDEEMELRRKHNNDFDEFKKTLNCDCRPMMVNPGTLAMRLEKDTFGCPEHCTHSKINTFATEWYCQCGASWED